MISQTHISCPTNDRSEFFLPILRAKDVAVDIIPIPSRDSNISVDHNRIFRFFEVFPFRRIGSRGMCKERTKLHSQYRSFLFELLCHLNVTKLYSFLDDLN